MSYTRARKELTPETAQTRLEDLCARSEQCESELRNKLRLWKIAPDDAEAIIDSLRRRRFVDDRRYAASFVRDKYRFNHWGRRKIEMALRQKRVASDIIAEAIDTVDEEEYRDIARQLLARKARDYDLDDYEGRMKLYRFGIARGFEPQLVAAIVKKLKQNSEQ